MGNGLGAERRSTKPLLNAQQSKRTKKADESRGSLLIHTKDHIHPSFTLQKDRKVETTRRIELQTNNLRDKNQVTPPAQHRRPRTGWEDGYREKALCIKVKAWVDYDLPLGHAGRPGYLLLWRKLRDQIIDTLNNSHSDSA
jgi:hypothetical protein